MLRDEVRAADRRPKPDPARADAERLRQLTGAVPATVYELAVAPTGEARYTFVSEGIRELLGLSPEAVIADRRLLLARVPAEHLDVVRLNAERAERENQGVRYDIQMRHLDGTLKQVRVHASLAEQPDGTRIWTGVLTDVSAERRAEDSLRESERMLRELTAAVPGVVYQRLVRPNGERSFVFMSEGIRTLLGVTPEQAKADPALILGMVAAEDRDAVTESRRKAIESVEPWVCEFQLCRPDGVRRWVRAHSTPQLRPDGSRLWTGVIIDITEAKRTQEALRRVEERAELALETAADGLWDWNIKTGDVYFTPQSLRMLGYDDSDGYNTMERWKTVYHPDDWPIARKRLQDNIAGRTPLYECEGRLRHKDGRYLWVLGRGRVVSRGPGGEALRMVGTNVDLTVRRAHERDLRASEERFRAAFEHAPLGVALVAPDTRFARVNEALCEMLGYSESELLGVGVNDVTHPDDIEPNDRERARLVAGEATTLHMEKRYIHKTGRVVWADLSSAALYDPDGRIVGFISHVQDITWRKHAEGELRASEDRYRAAAEGSLDAFFLLACARDARGRVEDFVFTDVNTRAAALVGLERDQILGRRLCELMPINRSKGFLERYIRVVETRQTLEEEFAADESPRGRWLRQQVVPVSDGIAITTRDVTRRKEQEEVLRQSVQQFQTLAAMAPVGIFQGSANGKGIFVNDEACRITGLDRTQLMGEGWIQAVHPDDRERVAAAWKDAVAKQQDYRIEHRFVANGQTRWVTVRAKIIRDARGGVESFLGTLVEITAIKEAEQQLREGLAQQQALLRRETALRRELDHRVRNNLAGLLGLISVYQRSARDPVQIAEALRGKVLAMKGVHEIIARSPGAPVGLAGLVERLADQLLVPGEVGRVCVAGPGVKVAPVQAGSLAMIVQELFTNSRKYGALSVPGGKIHVEWTAAPNAAGGTALDLVWLERGGPAVSGPRELGVGLRLIEGFASADLRGGAKFAFDGSGLRCDLRANLDSADDPSQSPAAKAPAAPPAMIEARGESRVFQIPTGRGTLGG